MDKRYQFKKNSFISETLMTQTPAKALSGIPKTTAGQRERRCLQFRSFQADYGEQSAIGSIQRSGRLSESSRTIHGRTQ